MINLNNNQLSYAEVVCRNRPPLRPDLRDAHILWRQAIDSSLSSWQHLDFFIKFKVQERIETISSNNAGSHSGLVAHNVNHVALNIVELFPYPIYLSSAIFPQNGIYSRYYLFPHQKPYENRGCCFGLTIWVAILYLQTQGRFDSPHSHFQWLSHQVEAGAPLPAVLLQNINGFLNTGKQLGLQIGTDPDRLTPLFAAYFHEQMTATLAKKIDKMMPGAYIVRNCNHQCLYIKP